MLLAKKIAVVIPAYRAKYSIEKVLTDIPKYVDNVIVVDDSCPLGTGQHVLENIKMSNVTVLFNDENRGVGGATKAGYAEAIKFNADIIFKIDADGQMDTSKIETFVHVLLSQKADYVKGNRFYFPRYTKGIPKLRLFGNLGLSFLTKLSSGYWDIVDPTNGYTAISKEALKILDLKKVDNRYFFESDLLFRLHIIDAKVIDIPCEAIYGDEVSSLNPLGEIVNFASKNFKNLFKRIIYEYFVRDFSMASIYLLLGLFTSILAIVLGSWNFLDSYSTGTPKPTGTVVLVAMLGVFAFQFLMSFLNYDITKNNNLRGIQITVPPPTLEKNDD